jgi:AcrR family transcriptional regulator
MAILDEAAEKGPAAVNIKLVAERAGVSVGSLYTYFPNRDGMLAFAVEVCVRFMTDMFGEMQPYLTMYPLRELLPAYVTYGVEWSQTYMGLLRLFVRAAYQGDSELAESLVRPIATLLLDMIRDILAVAAERGEIREDVDLEATARLVHALTIALGDSQLLPYLNIYFQVVDEDVPTDRLLGAFMDLILRGIGPKGQEEEENG